MNQDVFLKRRDDFVQAIGCPTLYEHIDQFALYAGMHTIGSKLFTYDLFKSTIDVPGDILEFGCWKGSNLMFLSKLKALLVPHAPKRVYGFDNFSGLPEPGDKDGDYAQQQAGQYRGNEEILRKAISLFQFDDWVQLIVGDAMETLPDFQSKHPEMMVSFAWLDFDLYAPTRRALTFLDTCISVGGVIVLDEACMAQWPGETLAMKEYLKSSQHEYKLVSNTVSRQPTVALVRVA